MRENMGGFHIDGLLEAASVEPADRIGVGTRVTTAPWPAHVLALPEWSPIGHPHLRLFVDFGDPPLVDFVMALNHCAGHWILTFGNPYLFGLPVPFPDKSSTHFVVSR